MKPILEPSISLRILGAVLTSQFRKVIDRTVGRVLELGWVAVAMLAQGGGLGPHAAGAEALAPAPAFSIQQREQAFWLVSPTGRPFFSLGVCCVNQGVSRGEFDPANPGYGAWRHYADSNQWANATLRRLKAWGFTTVGGWSDFNAFRACREGEMAFAPVLHIGSTAGAPWWDMWDPRVVQRMDDVAREHILPWRDDPRLIGYYSDNEIGWWDAILFKATLEQAPTSGQRQRLIELLRQTYCNEWSALLRDFEPAPDLRDWEELERHGILLLRPGGRGIDVTRRFLTILAERYYSLVHGLVRKYDRRALLLGDRYPSFYYPEVVRVAARYVDAVSINLNASWNDGRCTRFLLETLHRLSGKPILVGEFYLAAAENRSGNRNNHGSFPVAPTQKERAFGFRNTLEQLASLPYVIGADWFQYYDEPTHGRFDGENFNFGLVNIHDRPYEALTATAASLNLVGLKGRAGRPQADANQGIPPAPRDPLEGFAPGLALKRWDRERGFVQPVSEFPLADLYVCWNSKAVYLGLYAQDVVEDVLYRGKTVPAGDRAEWTVSLGEYAQLIRARIGAGREPVADAPAVRVVNLSGVNGDLRNIAGMELPTRLFGRHRFKRDDTLELASTLLTYGGAYRVEWRGRFTLRGK